MKKYKINKTVRLMLAELLTKTRLISYKRNRMLLTLVSPVRGDLYLGKYNNKVCNAILVLLFSTLY